MLIVGLTGGIGSGKSMVAALFAQLGVPIIDSDLIARDVVAHDKTVLNAIMARFGAQALDQNQRLDRAKLRRLVFENSAERLWLEQLLHPLIVTAIKERIMQLNAAYCIVVIPLLAEKPITDNLVDRILVVDAAEDTQIARTMQRDNHTVAEVQRIMVSQATRAQRLAIADDVITNDGDMVALQQAVNFFHQKYTQKYQTL